MSTKAQPFAFKRQLVLQNFNEIRIELAFSWCSLQLASLHDFTH